MARKQIRSFVSPKPSFRPLTVRPPQHKRTDTHFGHYPWKSFPPWDHAGKNGIRLKRKYPNERTLQSPILLVSWIVRHHGSLSSTCSNFSVRPSEPEIEDTQPDALSCQKAPNWPQYTDKHSPR